MTRPRAVCPKRPAGSRRNRYSKSGVIVPTTSAESGRDIPILPAPQWSGRAAAACAEVSGTVARNFGAGGPSRRSRSCIPPEAVSVAFPVLQLAGGGRDARAGYLPGRAGLSGLFGRSTLSTLASRSGFSTRSILSRRSGFSCPLDFRRPLRPFDALGSGELLELVAGGPVRSPLSCFGGVSLTRAPVARCSGRGDLVTTRADAGRASGAAKPSDEPASKARARALSDHARAGDEDARDVTAGEVMVIDFGATLLRWPPEPAPERRDASGRRDDSTADAGGIGAGATSIEAMASAPARDGGPGVARRGGSFEVSRSSRSVRTAMRARNSPTSCRKSPLSVPRVDSGDSPDAGKRTAPPADVKTARSTNANRVA